MCASASVIGIGRTARIAIADEHTELEFVIQAPGGTDDGPAGARRQALAAGPAETSGSDTPMDELRP